MRARFPRLVLRFGHRLARDRTGASAAEFALLAPLLASMIFGAIDLSLATSTILELEQAAGRTAELVTAPGTVALSYADLPAEARAAYGKDVDAAVGDNWLECDGVRQASFTGTCTAGQQTARYVSIRVTTEYVPIVGWGGLIAGNGPNNGFILTGDATVRVQ